MYATVALLNGCVRTFTYVIPSSLRSCVARGTIVCVPLQKRQEYAIVLEVHDYFTSSPAYTLRSLSDVITKDPCKAYDTFITYVCNHYCIHPGRIYRRLSGIRRGVSEGQHYAELPDRGDYQDKPQKLTAEQQKAFELVEHALQNGEFLPLVLHGVTGSGKTHVYLASICAAWQRGRSSLYMVPEVGMAAHVVRKIKAMAPSLCVFGYHSASSAEERRRVWSRIARGLPCVLVGVHLPPLMPVAHLGCIVVDEEHEHGYQEKRHPRLHSRDVAVVRASCERIPIILGSATPSLDTLAHIEKSPWRYVHLTQRFSGAFPSVRVVTLEKRYKRPFWLSKELDGALRDRLARGEQAILFLNRRGYSFFIQCRLCGYVATCTACAVSLTLHGTDTLMCHYCGHEERAPESCPSCCHTSFMKKGVGTQQIVSLVQKAFPQARVARADRDTTVDKKEWTATIEAFTRGDIDIIVGTQTITKGYHFPGVTLVGVIWGDVQLNMPFYTASEQAVQQLVQVAGRAGRNTSSSDVIVQVINNHDIFSFLQEERYLEFCEHEKRYRKQLGYPPYTRFAEFEIRNSCPETVDRDAAACRDVVARSGTPDMQVLGPIPPVVAKIKHVHVRKLYVKAATYAGIRKAAYAVSARTFSSDVLFTPHPLS